MRLPTIYVLLMVCCLPSGVPMERAAAAERELKVGALVMLTGPVASWGESARDGLLLAKERLDSSDPDAVPIKLLLEDFGAFDLKKAVSAAQKLISVDEVDILLTFLTEDTGVVWKIAADKQVPVIAMAAGGEDVTSNRENVFRMAPSDTALMDAAIRYASERRRERPCLIQQQIAYFKSMREFVVREWKTRSSTEIVPIEFSPEDTDFRTAISKLKAERCDVLFAMLVPNTMGIFLKQARAIQFLPMVFGPPASTDRAVIESGGSAANGILVPRFSEPTEWFVTAFLHKYGHRPDATADYAYDALMVAGTLLRERGPDFSRMIEGLSRISGHPGASGIITMSPERTRASRPVEMWTIAEGRAERKRD